MIYLEKTEKKIDPRPIGYRRIPTAGDSVAAAAPVLTLGEVDRPRAGEYYHLFECAFFTHEENDGDGGPVNHEYDGEYTICLSLLELSPSIKIMGAFFSTDGSLLGNIPMQPFDGQSVVKVKDSFQLSDSIDKDQIRLSVTAVYAEDRALHTVEQTVGLIYSNPGNFEYLRHDHPVKRDSHDTPIPADRMYGVTFYEGIPDNFAFDDNYVQIAMFRKPGDTKDVDYICAYGRDVETPRVGLPGQGTLMYRGAGNFKSCEATCLLRRRAGGVFVAAAAYETDASHADGGVTVIKVTQNGNQFTYQMPPDQHEANEYWEKNANIQYYKDFSNFWTETPFEYQMKLVFIFDSITTATALITSDTEFHSSEEGTDIFTVDARGTKVLPLKIGGGCLASGTKIITRRGTIAIEAVKIGDYVQSPEAPEGWAEVRNVWSGTEHGDMVEVNIDGQAVLMTRNHPVYTRDGYKKACELDKSQEVGVAGGGFKKAAVNIVKSYAGRVYNLDTEGDYGFAANGIIVGTNRMQNNRAVRKPEFPNSRAFVKEPSAFSNKPGAGF
jgi:hypothetical protein